MHPRAGSDEILTIVNECSARVWKDTLEHYGVQIEFKHTFVCVFFFAGGTSITVKGPHSYVQ